MESEGLMFDSTDFLKSTSPVLEYAEFSPPHADSFPSPRRRVSPTYSAALPDSDSDSNPETVESDFLLPSAPDFVFEQFFGPSEPSVALPDSLALHESLAVPDSSALRECFVKIPKVNLSVAECSVKISKFNSFPSRGVYPEQAKQLRNEFFPGKNSINTEDIENKLNSNQKFAKFFSDLENHKKKLGSKGTRSAKLQAMATIQMVVRGQSEGQAVIPQNVKSWFKNNIEKGGLKDYKKLNSQNPEFLENYNFMLQRYHNNKNTTDTAIRRILDE